MALTSMLSNPSMSHPASGLTNRGDRLGLALGPVEDLPNLRTLPGQEGVGLALPEAAPLRLVLEVQQYVPVGTHPSIYRELRGPPPPTAGPANMSSSA